MASGGTVARSVRFTAPASAKLADPTAEKVRANMALCIRELQKKVEELSSALDELTATVEANHP